MAYACSPPSLLSRVGIEESRRFVTRTRVGSFLVFDAIYPSVTLPTDAKKEASLAPPALQGSLETEKEFSGAL